MKINVKIDFKNLLAWLINKIKIKSTWIGVVSFLTAAGIYLTPDLKEAIIQLGLSIALLMSVIIEG